MGISINLLLLANALKMMLFAFGLLCVIFSSVALHADREFNYEMEDTKAFILNEIDESSRPAPKIKAIETRLTNFLYEYMKGNLTGLPLEEQKLVISTKIERYKRDSGLAVFALTLVTVFTFMSGINLCTRMSKFVNDLTTNAYWEIYYAVSCFAFMATSVLEILTAFKFEHVASEAEYPFGCNVDSDPATKGFESISVCQLYGAKIFAGITALACAIISTILVVIFVIIKAAPPSSAELEEATGLPSTRSRRNRYLGKPLNMDDMVPIRHSHLPPGFAQHVRL